MDLSNSDEAIVEFLRQMLPSVLVEPGNKPQPGAVEPSYHIQLPAPVGADYCFTIWLGGGEKQISARLLGEDMRLAFWYMPFEEASFRSIDELEACFRSTVEHLICNRTRIQQKSGVLFTHFSCDYESQSGWKGVYGYSAAKWIKTPAINTRMRVFQSPALIGQQ